MPGMFSRRRGSAASNRPMDASTSASATAAASQAFLHKAPSTTSLSSAAAAAALRSQTTTPDPIGSIQTKRMIRRGSVTSIGSASVAGSVAQGPPSRLGLQRKNSGGSMTERSFRTPSPGGRSNGTMSPVAAQPDAPPVPSIPASISQQHQRASSLDYQGRVTSPTPQRGRRGASVDRNNPNPPASPQTNRQSYLARATEASRLNSLRNFSRPMSPQPDSPTSQTGAASQYTHTSGSWHTGAAGQVVNAGTTARTAPATNSQQSKVDRILAAGRSQTPQTGRIVSAGSAQGSHLGAPINMPQRPHSVNSFRPVETIMVYDPNSRTFIERPKEPQQPPSPQFASNKPDPGVWDPNTRLFVARPVRSATASPAPPESLPKPVKTRAPPAATDTAALNPPPKNPARYSPTPSSPRSEVLNRQPSVVLEDREGEQEAEVSTPAKSSTSTVARTAPPSQVQSKPAAAPVDKVGNLNIPREPVTAPKVRNGSISPQRSAHFSPSPVLAAMRHDPPARDVSPYKSAMKQPSPASSVRANSPMASFKSPPSEISDNYSDVGSQDGLTPSGKKKKSVRVSFDEHAQAIGPAVDRPISPSIDDEGDAFMKPRPTLPSFGSVRKNRMQPEPAEKVTEMAPERNEVSSDHALGGILRGASSKGRSNEPLPPEVTSKEGAGYASDTDSDDGMAHTKAPVVAQIPDQTSFQAAQSNTETEEPPAINLLPPTPGLDEGKELGEPASPEATAGPNHRSSMEGIVVPGGWSKEEDVNKAASGLGVAGSSTVPTAEISHTGQPRLELSDIDENDSDDDAEFSDAAEDLSELEEGGFASLDAIVESPMVTPVKPAAAKAVVEPAAPAAAAANITNTAAIEAAQPSPVASAAESHRPTGSGDWSEATTYWSQLSKQQKVQMELEHLQSDDESPPAPVVAAKQPVKKKPQVTSKDVAAVAPPTNNAQSLKPAMKKSMRAQPAPAQTSTRTPGTMPRTMRGAGAPSAPQARASQPATVARSQSVQTPTSSAPPRPSTQPVRRGSTQQLPVVSTRLAKELSKADDSDSESSFKKRRRAGSNSTVESQGRYIMKASMRGGPVGAANAPPPPPIPADRRPVSPSPARGKGSLLRSLSPSGSLFGRSRSNSKSTPQPTTTDSGRMTSLRGSAPAQSARTTMRAPVVPSQNRSRFKSRFNDSDDEDDAPPGRGGIFRSRFADSDDDEPASPRVNRTELAPVRGIPRRADRYDGDSTDLEDSDDDDRRRPASRKSAKSSKKASAIDPAAVELAMAAARRNLGIESHEGEALAQGTLRHDSAAPAQPTPPRPESRPQLAPSPDVKRRSFMGSILRRSRTNSSSVPQVSTPVRPMSPASMGSPASPSSPIRGKLVRRTSSQTAPHIPSETINTTTPITTPAATADTSESWPLPPPIPIDESSMIPTDRPSTSDGVASSASKISRSMRPEMQRRSLSGQPTPSAPASGPRVRIQAGVEGSEPGERESDRFGPKTAKKKRFGMLRRAFKLDD